ncbi:MAG: hypothetical protein ACRC28_06550 [Clostridium sp.]
MYSKETTIKGEHLGVCMAIENEIIKIHNGISELNKEMKKL